MFLVRDLTCDESMVIDKRPKQIFCGTTAINVAKQFIIQAFAQQFWDKSVGMVCAKVVVAMFQRVYLVIVIKKAGYPEIFFTVGHLQSPAYGIEVVHRLVETTKLIANHAGSCLFAEWFEFIVCPVAHTLCHF